MKATTTKSSITSGRALRALTMLCLLCACGLYGVQTSAQTGMPGRILSSSGSEFGGIIEFNSNGSNVVNLSANTFDTGCTDEPAHKSVHPSATRDGRLLAFSSDRDRTGAVAGSFRIFVMNSDGTGVRQLTTSAGATLPGGTTANDLNPVISPDGSRVAFISERNRPNELVRSIFIVNTDGSGGVRQVTLPQTDTNPSGLVGGDILSVVWSPDGTRLAFKGTRLAADNSNNSPNFHHVIGFINADGTGESILSTVDSVGIVPPLDWSPDGRYIATTRGKEAQGAPAFRVILFDLQANTSREILQEGSIPGGSFNFANSGAFRFSPDSQRLAYTTDTSPVHLVVVDLNGVQQSLGDVPVVINAPLWWQAGAAIATPDRLELIPSTIVSRPSGPSVQLLPTLFDAAGGVIARAATGWTVNCSGGSVRASHQGLVTPSPATDTFSQQLCATNGGKQACVTVLYNPATNKIDEPEFFASYQYFDFLNRTPDAPGLAFWTGNITSCGSNAGCVQVKRINVSAAFFLSIEFQETGFLVHRLYKSAFGDLPGKPVPLRRDEFLPDTQKMGEGVVVNQGDWQQRLEQNKQDFVAAFVTRPRFAAAYPPNMTAAEFVDKLNQNAGSPLDAAERSQLIGELGQTPGDAQKRASVLRKVAEDQTLKDAEFRKAFVLMQYFGYLRRDPDAAPDADFSGYNFWLGKLNEFNGDFRRAEMVRAFIESTEYRGRFGRP